MGKKSLFLLLLVISPSLVAADKGKSAWWSTPLIIVLYIGFFVFAAGVAICVRRYRERHLHHHDIPRAPGLYPEEIESLPSLRFSEMKLVHELGKEDKQVECAVCLSEFKDQEVLRILPDCFHVFHPDCIAPWLATHFTCPVCRSSLEHRQGSSVSMSSIFDSTSGPFSQRFDHSGDQHDNHDDDHHVTVDIDDQGSSSSHLEVNLEDPPDSNGIKILPRSYSTGDLVVHMAENIISITRSTSLSSFFPKQDSPKSDYRTVVIKAEHWSCKSPKSAISNCHETSTSES
ncbi:RING-H2 finger protein ATL34 isoform X2 [Beta vulgaris subsp. vulgaris]|uniref:RING-H2 finger protein ATL34 isoform X2 n=1 Tax=Beta vulgaris subsp. vulgaris TaxID=3555 RepID=UPI002036CACF|nr:RING-H2 finger protein ATL34 isoform X2 [Beta vulgaris subsp. vulgaris]